MYRTLTALALSLLAFGLAAQSVPTTINYQGRLTDNTPAQTPVNATVPMSFAIYDAASAGTNLWQEPASGGTGVLVVNGIFNVALGAGGVALPPSVFTGATSFRYLEITMNPGASQEILTPRQLISATGYANLAQKANNADSAGNFTNALAGDVTGAQTATAVANVGGVSAVNVANGANLANAATNASTASTIVRRDATGSFAGGNIAATTVVTSGNATVGGTALIGYQRVNCTSSPCNCPSDKVPISCGGDCTNGTIRYINTTGAAPGTGCGAICASGTLSGVSVICARVGN